MAPRGAHPVNRCVPFPDADAELTGYYEKLAAAGTVVEPLAAAPWGDKFGIVSDPHGILWMVNIAGAQPAG